MSRQLTLAALLAAGSLLILSSSAKAGLPAARVGDQTATGGTILPPGSVTVLICGKPAARVGDQVSTTGGVGTIAGGSGTVMIGGKPAAHISSRVNIPGAAAAVIAAPGCPTVLIGG